MNIEQRFKAYKRGDLKAIYRIKLDDENSYHKKCIVIKICKLYEDNQ